MASEIRIQCEFGLRKKDGKIVRPASCMNQASGLFRITPKRGESFLMFLCADCGFTKMVNRVRMIVPHEEDPDQTPKFFRDILSVQLVSSLKTDFNQEDGSLAGEGVKHWVNAPQPTPRSRIVPTRKIVVTNRRKGKNLDMSWYLNTLRRHDDGK